ncbi:MAG: AAA family ATPase [Candidatus Methanolliviera hydrocarbonicum]|uniref:AAA family ATPase n=1 Tax=Candidatus Methanolliviera hydrocarbonicum TaxID=2491085 RepID=A0A520KXE5_9EURY|nr:MAG: AAA family ATPase [Candidatus Methanolliviera hydrocarbonicum]
MIERELEVSEAYSNDSGRGIARFDPDVLDELCLIPGDVVKIIGKRETVAKVWRLAGQDWNKGIIRMDGYLRKNAGVGIGDKVIVRKAEAKDAEEVVLSPPPGTYTQFGGNAIDIIKGQLINKAAMGGDLLPVMISSVGMAGPGWMIGGKSVPLIVIDTKPSGAVLIVQNTKLKLSGNTVKGYGSVGETGITYEDIGGLKEQIQKLRDMIELPMRHPEIFHALGIEPPKGVLLYGPPGTGKTLLAKAVANESGANFHYIAGPEIMNKYYGESEKQLRGIFEEAKKNAPSIIFIDELDSIASKREELTGEVERRVVAQLLSLLDGLEKRGQVVVMGATNRINAIDPALRRPGRFDREVEIGVPDREGRNEILKIHTRTMPLAENVELEDLSNQTHGFVGADILAFAREAAMKTLRRYLPEMNMEEEEIPSEILEKMKVTSEDFKEALKEIDPSALREVLIELPDMKWDDVGGLADAKREIKEIVELPLENPEVFTIMGIKPLKNVFLYGPPGTGKTLIAKAVASESGANFICVKGPQLLSKWVGESERAVREVFRKARQVAPCVIFFDEIDSIAPMRGMGMDNRVSERVVNQLLTELDGMEKMEKVVVMAATNMPHLVDPALLRPGRFDRSILLNIPDKKERLEIFKIHTRMMPLSEDVDLKELAEFTENYVGADIEAICREAAILAIRDVLSNGEDINEKEVEKRHFLGALEKLRPSVDENTMDYYLKIKEKFKSGVRRVDTAYVGYR